MNILQVATLYSWIVVVTLMGGFAGIFALMWFFTRHISKTILFSNLAILGGFILFHMAFLYHHSIDAPGDVITDGYINNRVIITYYLFLFSFSYFFLKSRFLLGYKILCTVLVFLLGFASLIAGLYAFPMIIFFHFFLIIFIILVVKNGNTTFSKKAREWITRVSLSKLFIFSLSFLSIMMVSFFI